MLYVFLFTCWWYCCFLLLIFDLIQQWHNFRLQQPPLILSYHEYVDRVHWYLHLFLVRVFLHRKHYVQPCRPFHRESTSSIEYPTFLLFLSTFYILYIVEVDMTFWLISKSIHDQPSIHRINYTYKDLQENDNPSCKRHLFLKKGSKHNKRTQVLLGSVRECGVENELLFGSMESVLGQLRAVGP